MELLQRQELDAWMDPPVWGMVHLAALPGSPDYAGDPGLPSRRALEDAERLADAGFGGLVIENYGDLPFHAERIEPVTIAAMSRVATELRRRWPDLRLMINCLRNDARAAISLAAACEADAIRVNVHTGAVLTDQGVLEGRAAETLRLRRSLAAEQVRIFADVAVKHAAPVAHRPLAVEASDLRQRGRADALLITGDGTGRRAAIEEVVEVRAGAGDAPVLVASGVDAESAARWAGKVDGAIIGSSLMHGGRAGGGVDSERARAVLAAWRSGRGSKSNDGRTKTTRGIEDR